MNQQTTNSDLMVSGPAMPDTPIDSLPDKEPGKKKGSAAGKVILVIICILLVILIALGALVFCALKDNMPQPGAEPEKLDIISAIGMNEGSLSLTLETKHIDYILSGVKDSVNSSDNGFAIKDLFCNIAEDKATVYGRIDVDVLGKTVTVPAKIELGISFAENRIKIDILDVTCGLISAPDAVITYALNAVSSNLPEGFTAENGSIYYDVTGLNELVDSTIEAEMGMGDSWLGGIITDLVQDLVNVSINGARIEGDKLIIEGSL